MFFLTANSKLKNSFFRRLSADKNRGTFIGHVVWAVIVVRAPTEASLNNVFLEIFQSTSPYNETQSLLIVEPGLPRGAPAVTLT